MPYFISTKFGFVSSFYQGTDRYGEQVTKAKHCIDVREALPFKTKADAEEAIKETALATWWHAVVKV